MCVSVCMWRSGPLVRESQLPPYTIWVLDVDLRLPWLANKPPESPCQRLFLLFVTVFCFVFHFLAIEYTMLSQMCSSDSSLSPTAVGCHPLSGLSNVWQGPFPQGRNF